MTCSGNFGIYKLGCYTSREVFYQTMEHLNSVAVIISVSFEIVIRSFILEVPIYKNDNIDDDFKTNRKLGRFNKEIQFTDHFISCYFTL